MQFIHQTVKKELDAGRVGCPVFVRCIAQVAKDSEHLTDVLKEALATAGSWLGASPLRVYAQGSKDVGQITATVLYESGQTALVSVGLAKPDGAPRIDLMLLGNKGALYHDGMSLSSFCTLLAEAGWQPITRAHSSDPQVYVERFGARYLTVLNDSTQRRTVTIRLDDEPAPASGRELVTGRSVRWRRGETSLTLDGEDVAVLELK